MVFQKISASAPGKLLLLGEYAVLEGAPALVAAVNRRAHATISTGPPGAVRVVAPDVDLDAVATVRGADWNVADPAENTRPADRACGPAPARAAPSREGDDHVAARNSVPDQQPHAPVVTWDREVRERGRVIGAVLGRYPAGGITLRLDSSGFFEPGSGKLGIGSSAAVTVAAAGALAAVATSAAPTLADLVHLHRDLQGGHGSGSDIAASLRGGVIRYRTGAAEHPQEPHPEATPVQLPDDLHWCCVYAGRATSTASYLTTLRAWRSEDPGSYRAHMGELSAIADAAATLLAGPAAMGTRSATALAGHPPAATALTAPALTGPTPTADLLTLISDYTAALERFGQAAGIDIVSADHAALRNQARDTGVIYKPSGAGGGDVGVAFARDVDHIAAFQSRASALGYSIIDMSIDSQGLTSSQH